MLAVTLLLWSKTIGPETVPIRKITAKNELASAADPPAKTAKATGKPQFEPTEFGEAERRAFLAAFRRQSDLTLVPCLQKELPGPASRSVRARLTKFGKLEMIRSLSGEPLATCMQAAIQEMRFEHLGEQLTTPWIEVTWRIDW